MASGHSVVWHDETKNNRLKELFDQHVSASNIAALLNTEFGTAFSRNAIIGRLHRLGLHHEKMVRTAPRPRVRKPRPAVAQSPGQPRPPRPPRPFTPRIVEIIPRNLALTDLAKGECRYECTKADSAADYRFCGHPVQPGSSFCRHHHAICWTRTRRMNLERAA